VYRGQFCVARYHRTPPKVVVAGIIGEAIRNMQAKKCLPQQKKKKNVYQQHTYIRELASRKGKTVLRLKVSIRKHFFFSLC
jgi:hypothetical protein